MQTGTALILLAPVLLHISFYSYVHRLGGLLEMVLVYSSFCAVTLGVLLLLIAKACSVVIRRSDSESPSRRIAVREDSGVRRILRLTVDLVVTGFALILGVWGLMLFYFPDLYSYQGATLSVLEILGLHILMTIVPILYLILIVAWIWSLVRGRAIAKAVPHDEPEQPEDEA